MKTLLSLILSLLLTGSVFADPLSFDFTAVFTGVTYNGQFPNGNASDSQIVLNQNFTLTLTYNPAVYTDSLPDDAGQGGYYARQSEPASYGEESVRLQFTFGNTLFDSTSPSPIRGIGIMNGSNDSVMVGIEGVHAALFQLLFSDPTGLVLDSDALPTSFDLTRWTQLNFNYRQPWGTAYTGHLVVPADPASFSIDSVSEAVPDSVSVGLLLIPVLLLMGAVTRASRDERAHLTPVGE